MNQYSRLYTFFFFILCFTCISKQVQAQCDPRRDSLALVALFDSTSGNNWTIKTNWKVVGQPISTWYGITTDAGGCVTCIDLDGETGCTPISRGIGNNLIGILPSNLDSLKVIRYLYLSDNKLNGRIPILNLPNLQDLKLYSNQLIGTMPKLNLPNLRILDFSLNRLKDTLPNFNSLNLVSLFLSSNQFYGKIPNFNSPNLQQLFVSSNQFTFQSLIPNILPINTKIYAPQDSIFKDTTYNKTINDPLSINLNIDDTVTTNIYKWYKNGTLFRTVNGSNKLSFASLALADAGVYTCEVTNPNAPLLTLYSRKATVLVTVVQNACRLSDSLELVKLYNATNGANWTNKWNLATPINTWYGVKLNANGCVECIDMDGILDCTLVSTATIIPKGNNLVGTIPNLKLDNLTALIIPSNKLTGKIPNFNLPNLQWLVLYDNQLNDTIPNFTAPNVYYLNLAKNQLSANIPKFSMAGLKFLFLAENKLSGNIPTTTTSINFMCQTNKFTFQNLLPNIIPIIEKNYAPQDSIFKDTTYQNTEGGNFATNLGIDDTVTTNIYKWYKNGTLFRTVNGSNKLSFASLALADAGVYTCQVTNPNAPLLTLFSRKATLKVLQTPPPTLTLLKDSLVLVFMDNVLATSANSTNIKVHGIETGFRTGTFTVQSAKVVFKPTTPFNTGEEIMVTFKSVQLVSGGFLSNGVIKKHIPVTVRSNPNFISPQYTGLQTAVTHDGGAVYAADLNRDGRVDLIQHSGFYGLDIPYTIQFQNSDGSFTTSQTITSNKYSGVGSLADLNNDGYPDLTVTTNAPSEFKVYLNDRTGRFTTGTSYNLPSFNDALTYGDVDGDGDIDFVSSAGLSGGTNYIGVAKNNGNGTFQSVVLYSIDPTFGYGVHLNDMDNDGDLDILLQGGNPFGKTPLIILFENDGLGNYSRVQQYGQINSNSGLIRDFNNDGKLDLITTVNDSLRLFLGSGNMTLQTPPINIDNSLSSLYSWFFGDFNGDNSMDFIISSKNVGFKPLRLYNNNGTGNFTIQQLCLTLDGGGSVSDINNDGKLDIAYWSTGSKKTFVVYQVPTIDSLKQDSICSGNTYRLPTGRIVSLAGTYLDTARSNIGCDSIRFTTKVFIKAPTDAIDDNVVVNETNAVEFTVTDNDRFDVTAQLSITLLKKPQYGTLTTLGNGKFRYESLPILRGVTQTFTYQLCNTLCPNDCDSARVTIDIQGVSPVQKASKGITPQNQDGKNDVLEFDETEDVTRYPESELIIYNRWNDIVFRAKPYLNNWDGNRNGKPLPAGTYYYILHLNQKEGKTLIGDVTIIR